MHSANTENYSVSKTLTDIEGLHTENDGWLVSW